jgi:hypothetical protein
MTVLSRWRRYAHDEEYRSLFAPDVLALSERAFGRIPGTQSLVGHAAGLAAGAARG